MGKAILNFSVAFAAAFVASAAFASVPALIPMPREVKFTGGSVALAEAHCAPLK